MSLPLSCLVGFLGDRSGRQGPQSPPPEAVRAGRQEWCSWFQILWIALPDMTTVPKL